MKHEFFFLFLDDESKPVMWGEKDVWSCFDFGGLFYDQKETLLQPSIIHALNEVSFFVLYKIMLWLVLIF